MIVTPPIEIQKQIQKKLTSAEKDFEIQCHYCPLKGSLIEDSLERKNNTFSYKIQKDKEIHVGKVVVFPKKNSMTSVKFSKNESPSNPATKILQSHSQVKVLYLTGPLKIATTGTILQPGTLGQNVKVALASGKIILAKVFSPTEVRYEP